MNVRKRMSVRNNAAEREKDKHGLNPFRYRGYYLDGETGFYYLQSRYYDPETGRFINADGLISTGTGVTGYNMYIYCNNNPVNLSDSEGNTPEDTERYKKAHPGPAYPSALVNYLLNYQQLCEDAYNTWKRGYDLAYNMPANYFVPNPNPNVPFSVSLESVDINLLIRLYSMGIANGLQHIEITDGYRSYEHQDYLHKNQGTKGIGAANEPGYSWHEYGGAVDISQSILWDLPNDEFHKFGLSRPEYIPGDPRKNEQWHIQLDK